MLLQVTWRSFLAIPFLALKLLHDLHDARSTISPIVGDVHRERLAAVAEA
jgi:hypothetical protein